MNAACQALTSLLLPVTNAFNELSRVFRASCRLNGVCSFAPSLITNLIGSLMRRFTAERLRAPPRGSRPLHLRRRATLEHGFGNDVYSVNKLRYKLSDTEWRDAVNLHSNLVPAKLLVINCNYFFSDTVMAYLLNYLTIHRRM